MPSWVKDIHDNILLPDPVTGKKQAWLVKPPWPDPNYEDAAKTYVHHQYRINLNDNTLMNLFRNNADADKPVRLTFAEYYEKPITEVLEFFKGNVPNMPKDDWDKRNKIAFSNAQWDKAVELLTEAQYELVNDGMVALQMKDLYLKSFHLSDREATLTKVWKKLDAFQKHLEWICVPFLKFPVKPNAKFPRPEQADLDLHLNGGVVQDPAGADRKLMPFGGFDYYEMLFHNHKTQDEACEHRNARIFAHCKGFFDKERVTDRVRRVRDNKPQPNPPEGVCFDPGLCPKPHHPAPMMGGGNGYECRMVGGVRQCVVDQPVDYCVNNGSKFCP
jgi:hypothetical protein